MYIRELTEDFKENTLTSLLLFCYKIAFHCQEYYISFKLIKIIISLIFRIYKVIRNNLVRLHNITL